MSIFANDNLRTQYISGIYWNEEHTKNNRIFDPYKNYNVASKYLFIYYPSEVIQNTLKFINNEDNYSGNGVVKLINTNKMEIEGSEEENNFEFDNTYTKRILNFIIRYGSDKVGKIDDNKSKSEKVLLYMGAIRSVIHSIRTSLSSSLNENIISDLNSEKSEPDNYNRFIDSDLFYKDNKSSTTFSIIGVNNIEEFIKLQYKNDF